MLGLTTLFLIPRRVAKHAVILKPAILSRFHRALVDRKYRRLFSSAGVRAKSGPKGPPEELIAAIVEIDKDVVRRVLARHFTCRYPDSSGLSWLTLFAHTKDSLWSVDLFRCESILLRSHWVLVVIDVFTRRIVGFGIDGEFIDGATGCRVFNLANAGHAPPKRISTDHDPLFRFHRWLANLRILEVGEI